MPSLTNQIDQSFSGAPSPPPPLSGLLFGGNLGLSGSQDRAAGGLAGGALQPGIQGGPGLELLSLLAQLSQGGEVGGAAIPNLNLLQGALGQAPGGFGGLGGGGGGGVQSPFFQQIGQQGRAGQTAGATGGTQGDLLSILKSALSVGQKGTDLFAALTGSAQGTDLQLGRGQVGGFSLFGQPGPASPTTGDTPSLTGGGPSGFATASLLQDPTLKLFTRQLLSGSLTPQTISDFSSLPQSVQQQFSDALFRGQITPSLGETFQAGGTGGFTLGVPPLDAGGSGGGGPSGTGGFDLGTLGPLGTLGSVFGAAASGSGLARDIKSGSPLGAVQDLLGLYKSVQPLLSQAGVNLPAVPGIADLFKLVSAGEPGSLIGKLGASLGQIAGIAGPVVGALGGLGLFGSGPSPSSVFAVPGATLGALSALGPAAATAVGAGLGVAGPGLTALADRLFAEPADRKAKEIFAQKSILDFIPHNLSRARAVASGGIPVPSPEFLLPIPSALSAAQIPLARRFEAQLGGLQALEELGEAQSIAGRRKFGLRPFPNVGLTQIIQQLGRQIVPQAFAAQQAAQTAGITPELLRRAGAPFAFGPEGIKASFIERFGQEPSEGGGGIAPEQLPVGNVFLNDIIAKHLAAVYGVPGAIPNFGPIAQPGTPEFQAALNSFQFRPQNKVGFGNVLGFPNFHDLFFNQPLNEATLAP